MTYSRYTLKLVFQKPEITDLMKKILREAGYTFSETDDRVVLTIHKMQHSAAHMTKDVLSHLDRVGLELQLLYVEILK